MCGSIPEKYRRNAAPIIKSSPLIFTNERGNFFFPIGDLLKVAKTKCRVSFRTYMIVHSRSCLFQYAEQLIHSFGTQHGNTRLTEIGNSLKYR